MKSLYYDTCRIDLDIGFEIVRNELIFKCISRKIYCCIGTEHVNLKRVDLKIFFGPLNADFFLQNFLIGLY